MAQPAPRKVDLEAVLGSFTEAFAPRLVADLNGQHVRLARIAGPFVWHRHADQDELFLVLHGAMQLEFRDRTVPLGPGELLVVPAGTEHRPVGLPEASVLLFEPADTLNTGDVDDALTRRDIEDAR